MKIAFLQETVNQNIGIMYLSAILKSRGHHCELFVKSLEKNDFFRKVIFYKPDILGFSVITGSHRWALRTADCLKERLSEALVVLGGPHPTYFPEVVNENKVDVIARGEAELSFAELIQRMEEGRDFSDVLGLWVKRNDKVYRNDVAPLVEDLSSLPHPDHKLYLKYSFYQKQTEVPFSTIRGCPYRCSFCYNHTKAELYRGKGCFVRTRDISDIINEMRMACSLYPNMRTVILYDDIIGIDKKWLADFCDAYANYIKLPWFTSIRPDKVDEFTVTKLAAANCFCLSMGVETGDEELRTRILCKKISNSRYIEASDLLHKAGIKVRTSNMFFLPGEDIDKAITTVEINREMKTDFAWGYTLQPYPGTDIYEYAVNNGYLPPDFQFDDIDPLGLTRPIIQMNDRKKIKVLHRLFHLAVHNDFIYRVIRKLVLIPPNPIFDMLYYYSLIASYAKYHKVSLWRAASIAWSNYKETKIRQLKKERW
ncbi:MAG: B12-binding domain-containing radical SAM protein [Candidatus Omnitrophica bacterium]|nr:B12-binding domain-containing radical SAM protein [Candidatus Omnitrophota bacterium]